MFSGSRNAFLYSHISCMVFMEYFTAEWAGDYNSFDEC